MVLCRVFAPSLLDRSTDNLSHVGQNFMLEMMFWSCTRSLLHVYMLCSLYKHMSHSHMKLYVMSCNRHRGHSLSQASCLALAFSVSHVQHIFMMVWGILSSSYVECVFSRLWMYKCTRSHTQSFCWNFDDWITLNSHTFTLQSSRPTITLNNAEVSKKPFQFMLVAS